ncbi:hypothetical protein QAD02_015071 [Eretmocerus hayati]|uniref:Uncharacterized protein n=1 Tax=Eretmocerus hayati TaxID=131215 RepID=A0ACC2P6Q9_9HYME|nr:hypothetical protein QAD02_015071 [Eretmocerus hayati]
MAGSAATAAPARQAMKYLMGKCMPSFKTTSVKVEIPKFEYDENLHMHFRTYEYLYAHDPNKVCKTGDMVLVQSLPEKLTRLVTHKVVEVVFPLGNITDPITGKKVVGSKYRDDIKEVNKLYGKMPGGFDYEKAPPRGYLEDTRDFTHKPAYQKYYEDPDDPQPYAVY